MIAALKEHVLPALRERGFKGSFPHFRRPAEGAIHLLTFQFDRNGGAFLIEIAASPVTGATTHWGKHIPPQKVTAWDISPPDRPRLRGKGDDCWFRYDTPQVSPFRCRQVALEVLPWLDQAERWWAGRDNLPQRDSTSA